MSRARARATTTSRKVHRFEHAVRWCAALLFGACFLTALGWHFTHFPPRFFTRRVAGADAAPCCWHALACARDAHGARGASAFSRDDFGAFACVSAGGVPALASADARTAFSTCGEYVAYANASRHATS